MRLIKNNERGDTIVEVLFAVSVFAIVAVGAMAIMNRGTSTAQRSLEITQVRHQIDAQAEAIRFIHKAYVDSYQKNGIYSGTAAEWNKMVSKTVGKGADQASVFGANSATCPGITAQKPFILNARKATVADIVPSNSPPSDASIPPYSQVIYNNASNVSYVYGLWVESIPASSDTNPGFVDFHIRACWESPGSSTAVTLGTIVRLYEPR